MNVSGPSRPQENRAILYVKTADIPDVLVLVDMAENVSIMCAHPSRCRNAREQGNFA